MLIRLAIILFVAGLFLIGSGSYNLFVQAGASAEPTRVSVAELEKNVPSNRHLVVTGGKPVLASAVTFYKTQYGSKVSGSEITFIPITDASNAASARSTPRVLLRITEEQLNAAKAGDKFNFDALEGLRTTSMDLEGKVRGRLLDTYDKAAVDQMIILDYHGKIGMGTGFAKLAGGLAMSGGVIVAFLFNRRSKHPTAPMPPPPVPRATA
jgi:hypothetical protein